MKEIEYVGFWKRVLAFLLDAIIFSPIVFLYMRYDRYFLENRLVFPVLLYLILPCFFQVFLNVKYGGTPGKLIVGIRIVDCDGHYISLMQSIYRVSPQIIASILSIVGDFFISGEQIKRIITLIEGAITWFYFIDVLVIVFNKKRRAIHDYIASTYVVTKQSMREVE
jgi:uncharacterized RDD family membrane protein YckC